MTESMSTGIWEKRTMWDHLFCWYCFHHVFDYNDNVGDLTHRLQLLKQTLYHWAVKVVFVLLQSKLMIYGECWSSQWQIQCTLFVCVCVFCVNNVWVLSPRNVISWSSGSDWYIETVVNILYTGDFIRNASLLCSCLPCYSKANNALVHLPDFAQKKKKNTWSWIASLNLYNI